MERSGEAGDRIKQIRSNTTNLPIKADATSRVAVQWQRPGVEEEGPQTCWKRMRAPTCEFLPSLGRPRRREHGSSPARSPLRPHAGRIRCGRKAGRSARRAGRHLPRLTGGAAGTKPHCAGWGIPERKKPNKIGVETHTGLLSEGEITQEREVRRQRETANPHVLHHWKGINQGTGRRQSTACGSPAGACPRHVSRWAAHVPDGQGEAKCSSRRNRLCRVEAAQPRSPLCAHPLEMLSNALETFPCVSEAWGRAGSLLQPALGARTNVARLVWLYKGLVYLYVGGSLATCPSDIPSPNMSALAWPQSTLQGHLRSAVMTPTTLDKGQEQ